MGYKMKKGVQMQRWCTTVYSASTGIATSSMLMFPSLLWLVRADLSIPSLPSWGIDDQERCDTYNGLLVAANEYH